MSAGQRISNVRAHGRVAAGGTVLRMTNERQAPWPASREARSQRSARPGYPSERAAACVCSAAAMRALTVVPGAPGSAQVREVPDPEPRDEECLVEVIRVGLCGTDAEIERGEYGTAPEGSDVLVLGHESLGRIVREAAGAGPRAGTLVVASVRRPGACPNCARGEQDMCLWGDHRERGIAGLHGFCAERYTERPEFLFPLPDALEAVAVLLEPLTISEKGWRHVAAAQRRMTVWEPRRAIVAGAGPVGLLAAMVLRLRGLDVVVVERSDKPARRALLARIGASYAATSVTPLAEVASALDRVDLVVEATGSAAVAFEAMRLVGANGAVLLTSVTGGGRTLELPAGDINNNLVLRNVLVLGTVNANALDFRAGIDDLTEAERRWPGFLASLITRRVPLSGGAAALAHDGTHIKTVVEVGARS